MKILPTAIPDALIIEPTEFGDACGFFFECFNAREFKRLTGLEPPIMQDNHSRLMKNVLRDLRFQRPLGGPPQLAAKDIKGVPYAEAELFGWQA